MGTGLDVLISWLGARVGDASATIAQVIFDFIKSVVGGLMDLVGSIISGLPNAGDLGLTVPSGWIQAYSWFDTFLPLHEALGLVAMFVGIYLAIFSVRVAVFVYHLIPKPLMGT